MNRPLLRYFEDSEEFSPPRIALIEAAERLFGDRTIESVSLREIAVAAGNGNNNAVQYHFGSKESLIDAIFVHRVRQMDAPRRAMLEAMERDDALGDLRRIVEAFSRPILDITDAEGRHTYAGFLQQYILRYRPRGLRHAIDRATESTVALRRLQALVQERLSDLSGDLVQMRLGLAHLIFINMLVWSDHDGLAISNPTVFNRRVDDALDMAAAALGAPKHP